ncbi:MAG: LicD family protein [Ruminococcus sp.]|nr:LicD family protein [Ruminococcus sp.]
MNETQQKCFDILVEIDRVCKAANLKYFIYAGTLLGAVRHNGFIPWDDDIDIVMMRKDYNRFPQACLEYLNKDKFELQSIYTDPNTSNPWMKLHDRNTAFISGGRKDGAMEGINIDIFPIDNAPEQSCKLKNRARYFDTMNFIYQYRFQYHNPKASWKMRVFQYLISFIPPFKEQAFKEKYDRKIQDYNHYQTRNVVYFSNRKYMRKVIDRSVFAETEFIQFETQKFPAPSGWKEVLIHLYGDNYMQLPPIEQQKTVHGSAIVDLEHSWREYKRGDNGYEKI